MKTNNMKHISDYTIGELHSALIDGFLEKLDIAGSTAHYNLYNCVSEALQNEKNPKIIKEE